MATLASEIQGRGDHKTLVASLQTSSKGHLHDGQQGVDAIEVGALGCDRHADHRQRRRGSHHARQMRRAARARDDDLPRAVAVNEIHLGVVIA